MLGNANLPNDSLAAGRALGVDFVIDGHVQRMDDRLRVTVQMIMTSDGAALWAMPFDEIYQRVCVAGFDLRTGGVSLAA
ncbi:MAG: hypothetical protein ABIP78_06880 [Pyrinomonadaceae bacterium]